LKKWGYKTNNRGPVRNCTLEGFQCGSKRAGFRAQWTLPETPAEKPKRSEHAEKKGGNELGQDNWRKYPQGVLTQPNQTGKHVIPNGVNRENGGASRENRGKWGNSVQSEKGVCERRKRSCGRRGPNLKKKKRS